MFGIAKWISGGGVVSPGLGSRAVPPSQRRCCSGKRPVRASARSEIGMHTRLDHRRNPIQYSGMRVGSRISVAGGVPTALPVKTAPPCVTGARTDAPFPGGGPGPGPPPKPRPCGCHTPAVPRTTPSHHTVRHDGPPHTTRHLSDGHCCAGCRLGCAARPPRTGVARRSVPCAGPWGLALTHPPPSEAAPCSSETWPHFPNGRRRSGPRVAGRARTTLSAGPWRCGRTAAPRHR